MSMIRAQWHSLSAVLGVWLGISVVGCKTKPAAPPAIEASGRLAAPNTTNARTLPPSITGIAFSPDGKAWMTGRLDRRFDFGSGVVSPSSNADLYLATLDPTICRATATFVFGGPHGDKASAGVAVARNGNVGIIGRFSGEIDFTPANADSPRSSENPRVAGLDFLRSSGPANAFYAVFDGSSRAGRAVPIKAHTVDAGTGGLTAIGSHPQQNAFAVCGKTNRAVPQWSDDAANKGVITSKRAPVPGGGMDLVVAKIDAANGSVLWGRQFGGDGDQLCGAATLDGNGDVVIAGSYTGKLAFDRRSLPEGPDLALLLFAAKLDGSTGATIAANGWGKGGRSYANSIAVDGKDNVFVGGTLGASIDFEGGLGMASEGMGDAFVAKLSPTLAPTWAKSFGDSSFEQTVKSVAVTAAGDVLIAGAFTGSLGTLGLVSSGPATPDAFTAKLAAADGTPLFAHAYGDAENAQSMGAIAVARTATGALADLSLAAGIFTGTIAFESTTLRASDIGGVAGYLARLAP